MDCPAEGGGAHRRQRSALGSLLTAKPMRAPYMAPLRSLLPGLSVAVDDVFAGGQLFHTHGAAGVHLLGRDADLRAQTELAAVGEAGGGVDIDRRRVHR